MNLLKLIIIITSFFTTSAFSRLEPLTTVENVNIERYLGTWYEIARINNKFQRNCHAGKVEYIKSYNSITVIDHCSLYSADGQVKKKIGNMWITDKQSNAKLRIQFFLIRYRSNKLSGRYWILDLDQENYTYAIVGDPSRQYFWIYARDNKMDDNLYNELIMKARQMGFDTTRINRTEH